MRLIISAFAAFIFFVGTAKAENAMSILCAKAYSTTPAQKNGAVFLRIENKDINDNALLEVKSDIARNIELHTHIIEDDVMRMRAVNAIEIPKSQTSTLSPMGDHIMLIDLNKQLVEGESFQVSLRFKNGQEHLVTVPVYKPGQSDLRKDCDSPSHRKDAQTGHDAHSGH